MGDKKWDEVLSIRLPNASVADVIQIEARCRIAYTHAASHWGKSQFIQAFYCATIAEECAILCGLVTYAIECRRFRIEIQDHMIEANALESVLRSEVQAERPEKSIELGNYESLANAELRRGNYEVFLEHVQHLPYQWARHYRDDIEFCGVFLQQQAPESPQAMVLDYWVKGDDQAILKVGPLLNGSQRFALSAQLIQIWAYLQKDPGAAAALIRDLFIDSKLWDLRLLRSVLGMEILLSDPSLFSSLPAQPWVNEALDLLGGNDYISTDSPMLTTLVQNTPSALFFLA
jgi:hypothetical protein